jgi:hypothetical protein
MISVLDSLVLMGFGGGFAAFMICLGTVLHMRYLDRRLIKPVTKQTQQLPAVKP